MRLRGDERADLVIHLTAAACPPPIPAPMARYRRWPPSRVQLNDLAAGPPRPYAHVAGGPGLPDAVVQRLTRAGRIRIAVHDRDDTVLDLGRSHGLVSDRLYRTLIAETADVFRKRGDAHLG